MARHYSTGMVPVSREDSTLILVRHGQSQWNLENRFTGWVDVPLTEKGEAEARRAGELLLKAKTHVDVAFTSDLVRAQRTLGIVLEVLHQTPPVAQSQALNERHYGDLQGKNKEELAKQYGAEQVHIWRRSYDVPPPNGESLKDCSARTLPYYREKILPELRPGRTVLVVAHGNSLRSLVMDIEHLSREQVLELNLDTGVPIIYAGRVEAGHFVVSQKTVLT